MSQPQFSENDQRELAQVKKKNNQNHVNLSYEKLYYSSSKVNKQRLEFKKSSIT